MQAFLDAKRTMNSHAAEVLVTSSRDGAFFVISPPGEGRVFCLSRLPRNCHRFKSCGFRGCGYDALLGTREWGGREDNDMSYIYTVYIYYIHMAGPPPVPRSVF